MANEKVSFKDATIKNQEQIVAIYQEFIDITHASQPGSIKDSFKRFINNNDGKITMISYGAELAGFAEYRPLPLKLRDKKQKIEITSLFVRPKFQKLGLGKALIEYIKNYADLTNRDRVVLYSGIELDEAHKFYEKVGFDRKAYFFELKVKK